MSKPRHKFGKTFEVARELVTERMAVPPCDRTKLVTIPNNMGMGGHGICPWCHGTHRLMRGDLHMPILVDEPKRVDLVIIFYRRFKYAIRKTDIKSNSLAVLPSRPMAMIHLSDWGVGEDAEFTVVPIPREYKNKRPGDLARKLNASLAMNYNYRREIL